MKPEPQLTDDELLEKYRDPDEIENERIDRIAQREADTENQQESEENNETIFL